MSNTSLVHCDDREKLTAAYISAVAMFRDMAKKMGDTKSPGWQEATGEARSACNNALTDLNQHKKFTAGGPSV
jgi:hypothetical protein